MFTTILMLSTLFFAYALFGHWVIRQTRLKFSSLEKLVLSLVISIAILPSCIALLGYFIGNTSFALLIPAVLVGVSEYKQFWKTLKALRPSSVVDWIGICIGICAVVSVGSMQFLSGSTRESGVLYQDVHDSMWHVALGRSILEGLPPAHPADPSLTLTQYHYFFDVFLASLSYFSNSSLIVLNYWISPVLTLTILTGTAFILGNRLTNKQGGIALMALTAWTGSFAYMIPWFLADHTWTESSFWVSQTFAMLINPQVLFSFAAVYVFFLLQLKPFRTKKSRHIILIPLVATSIGFKSYGWVVLSLLYAVDLLWEIIQTRNLFSVGVGLLYLAVAAPFVWLITHFSTGGTFFYEPLWYINTMVEAPDRLNHIQWKLLEDHYRLKQNWPRVIEIKTKEFFVFYFGNLGIRSLFLLLLPVYIFKRKKLQLNWKVVSLACVGFLFATSFPLFFLQAGIVWNSIQFWYYALILANILLLVMLFPLFQKVPRTTQGVLILLLFCASIPAFIRTTHHKLANAVVIPHEHLALIAQLKEDDRVVICPEDTPLFKTALVQALSPATVILSDPVQLELVGAASGNLESLEEIFQKNQAGTLRAFLSEQAATQVICSNPGMTKFITTELATKTNMRTQTASGWHLFSL